MSDSEQLDVQVAVIQERIRGLQIALELQATEYLRRLNELNHAHAKQVENQATYVNREVYEANRTEDMNWRSTISDTLSELKGKTQGIGWARSLLFQILPMVISALALAVLYFKTTS